jgi:hypothetical protein
LNVRNYLQSRRRDPVTWIALSFIGAWAVSALFSVAPWRMLSLICFALSAVEWWSIFSWRRKRRRADAVEVLGRAMDRWKIGLLLVVGIVTFVLELWVGSSTFAVLGLGLTVLGISSLVTLWYAWSRPIVVTREGLLIGADNVKWNDVRGVSWSQAGFATIDFAVPNYFYGTNVRVSMAPAQAANLDRIIPKAVRRTGDLASLGPRHHSLAQE